MKQRRLFLASLLCVVGAQAADGIAAGRVHEEETRIYAGDCLMAPKLAPTGSPTPAYPLGTKSFLGSIIGPAAIDFVINGLKAAGQAKEITVSPGFPRNTWMYQSGPEAKLQPFNRCIQIIAGSFGEAAPYGQQKSPLVAPDALLSILEPYQKKGGFPGLQRLRLFFELELRPPLAHSGQAPAGLYTLKPTSLWFGDVADSSGWDLLSLRTRRSLAISLSFRRPSDEIGKGFASAQFSFRELLKGSWLDNSYFEDLEPATMELPALADEDKKVLVARQQPVQQCKLLQEQPEAPAWRQLDELPYADAIKALCKADERLELRRGEVANSWPDSGLRPSPHPSCVEREERERDARAEHLAKLTAWHSAKKTMGEPPSGFCPQCCEWSKEKTVNLMPVTISANVSEVRGAKAFAAFLGGVLEKAKPALEERLKESTPAGREASTKADEAYLLALAEAEIAIAKLGDQAEAKDRLAALAAQVKANQAARAANRPEPYPGIRP